MGTSRLYDTLDQLEIRHGPVFGIAVKLSTRSGHQLDIERRGDVFYSAASIAKLGIEAYAGCRQKLGTLQPDEPWTLQDEMKRPGTGVLRHFSAGTRLTASEARALMLAESDNTATNLVLAHLGCQQQINAWLYDQGVVYTGLGDRTDRLFESTVMRPRDGLALLELVSCFSDAGIEAMRRSHFTHGLREHLERRPSGSDTRHKRVERILHAAGSRMAISYALNRPKSLVAANKEGLLQYDGSTLRHEVALLWSATGGYAGVAVFTRDAPRSILPEIGRAIYDTLLV